MSEQDDRKPSWQEAADSSGSHPVLADVTEAAAVIGDAAAFLSPTRQFDEPHLEEDDWPRDLDGPATLAMLGQLAGVVDATSGCLAGITCQHAIADTAKPALDEIATLLTATARKLHVLSETAGRDAGTAASPARQAGQDFPHGPVTHPPADSGQKTASRSAAPPAAGHRNTP